MPIPTNVLGLHVSARPPSDAGANTMWLSQALADARYPDHPGQTFVLYDGGAAAPAQEPNGWYYNGRDYVTCNSGGGQTLLVTPNGDYEGDWTKVGVILGVSGTQDTAGCTHPSLRIDRNGPPLPAGKGDLGGTLYLYYINGANGTTVKCATTTMAMIEQVYLGTLPIANAYISVTSVLTKSATVLPNLSQFGNFGGIQRPDGTSNLWYEATLGSGTDSWVSSLAVGPTPNGAFATRGGPMGTLQPLMTFGFSRNFPTLTGGTTNVTGFQSSYSIGQPYEENGQYVNIYHSGGFGSGDGSPFTEIYRAFSPVGDGQNWKVDNGGYPIYSRRDNRYEGDQVADPAQYQRPYGTWLALWTAASNPDARFVIKAAPLSPTLKIWNANHWVNVDQLGGAGNARRGLMQRGRMAASGFQIYNYDDCPIDPGATANFPVALPTAFAGNECLLHNVATTGTYGTSTTINTGTVLPTLRVGDAFFGTHRPMLPGEVRYYFCRKPKVWEWISTGGRWDSTQTVAFSATPAPNAANGSVISITLTANITAMGLPTNLGLDEEITYELTQDATGGWTVAWPATYIFGNAWSNTGNTANTKTVAKFKNLGGKLYCISGQNAWG